MKKKFVLAALGFVSVVFLLIGESSDFKKVLGYGYGYSAKITTVRSYKPAFSPDGNYLVFANVEDRGILYKKSFNGSTLSDINNVNSYEPVYSPDGLSIVYSNFNDGGRLYLKSAGDSLDGSPITDAYGRYPIYSPDGNYIVYVNFDDGRKLYRKSASDALNGSAINSVNSSKAAYSPDGNYLVYPNMEDRGFLYRKAAGDSSNGSVFIRFSSLYPAYSPDGDYLVFSNVDDSRRLYRKNLSGTGNGTSITQNGKCDSPVYSPDGNYIVYERGGRIYKKDLSVTDIGSFSLEGTFNGSTSVIQGTTNKASGAIEVVVPYGTDVSNLKPLVYHFGASVSPASGVSQNFSSPVTYTVTSLNGETKNYTVTVRIDSDKTKKSILSFSSASPSLTGTINESAKTISVVAPYGTNVTNLAFNVTHNGASVSPASGTAKNFSSPVVYRVTALDGSTRDYTVTVTISNDATNSSVSDVTLKNDYNAGYLSIEGTNSGATDKITFNVNYSLKAGSINVTVPAGTQMTSLDGKKMDLGKISLADIQSIVEDDLKSGLLGGAIKFGLTNMKVSFSKPVTISIPVNASYNKKTLKVFYQTDKGDNWHQETTCLVSNAICTFQTNHATKFAALEGNLKNFKNYKGTYNDLTKYKFYKGLYDNKASKKANRDIKEIKKTNYDRFLALRKNYLIYKSEKKEILEAMGGNIVQDFYLYKNYNGYKNYSHYRKIVGR